MVSRPGSQCTAAFGLEEICLKDFPAGEPRLPGEPQQAEQEIGGQRREKNWELKPSCGGALESALCQSSCCPLGPGWLKNLRYQFRRSKQGLIEFNFPGTPHDNYSLPEGKELSQHLTTPEFHTPQAWPLGREKAQSLGEGVHLLEFSTLSTF